MSGNNKKPKNARRIQTMLDICLAQKRPHPDLLVNAAFAYLELEDVDRSIELLRQARKRGVDLGPYLSDPALAQWAEDRRVVALKRVALAKR